MSNVFCSLFGGVRLRLSVLYSILIHGLKIFPLSALPLLLVCPIPTARLNDSLTSLAGFTTNETSA